MSHHPQHAMLTALDTGFGIVGIASFFMVMIWGRIAFSGAVGHSKAYKIVAWGLFISSIGIMLMATDRILGRHEIMTFEPGMMLLASIFVLFGKTLMITATAYNGYKRTVAGFGFLSLCWAIFCISGAFRSLIG